MSNWSFDILRQGGWDLWTLVCVAASIVLISYAAMARLWSTPRGIVALALAAAGAGGTLLVLVLPPLRTPLVGLVWTFALLAILSATFYLNLMPQLGAGRTATLLALRVTALAMLVPMLFEPVVRYVQRPRVERPIIFLIDNSGSMSFPDVQNGPTRLQSVWQTLSPQLNKIREHFVPQFVTFASSVQELNKPDELATLQADGKSTDIVNGVIQSLTKTTRDDAVMILISDGIDNTSPNVTDVLRASRRAIHTVSVGSEQAEPATLVNVAVDNVEAADDFVINNESKVKATIKSSALANRVVEVKMSELDASGQAVGQPIVQTLVLQPSAAGQTVELPFKPKTVGVQRLAVWIDPIAGERSTVDNRQEFQGLALDPRVKVLYVEGRARPEYRELNRALARDPNIEAASLLRIQGDRFAASGAVNGEPLRYMPATLDEWKKFDVIILGDLDSSYLTKAQQMAIEQVTGEKAGLLMIGGQNSFGPGGYKDSPIEKALPVFVGPLDSPQEKTELVPWLTSEGAAHPAMEGLSEWFNGEGGAASKTLPALRGNVVVQKEKSGAEILLVHKDRPGPDGRPQILLAVQRYGEGRSAAFTADTTYLWYLPLRGMGQDSPYNRFWGQLIRWLAGEDARHRQRGAGVEGLLNKSFYQLGESVRLRAMVRDERGDATRYAQVNLVLRRDNAEPKQLPLSPMQTRNGMYDVTAANLDKGEYSAELIATKDGKELGRQMLKFTVIPPADEMLKLAADVKLMSSIADATRGFHYPLAQLPGLLEELIRRDLAAATARQETIPLANWVRTLMALGGNNPQWPRKYDLPMQGLLVIALLAAEWTLRRKWQLP